MSVDRSLRSTLAAILLVAALFIAMNRIVASAPVADWFLPLALLIVGAALVPNWNISRSRADDEEEDETLSGADVHTYRIEAQQVPRLQTMTIRPDPETSERVVTITEDTAGDVLPFIETEVVPDITPTPPPTPPPAAPTMPAPSDAAEPESVMAETEAPVAPAPDDSGTVGSPDNLTKINGVGPKSAAALKAAGIDSFNKLANSSEDQIRAALSGVRLVGDVSTWAQQASYAAQGDWAGLNEFNAAQRKPATGD
ncbi:MAG: hypothetical protein GC204_13130 [Chloroflexi bacterium]|nr:hypothetical protein [Chloroflexota bacterium]